MQNKHVSTTEALSYNSYFTYFLAITTIAEKLEKNYVLL